MKCKRRDSYRDSFFLTYFFNGDSPVTVIPMLRAVPATMLIADSMVKQFKSAILFSAIARIWSHFTEPTLLRFDSLEPLLIFATSNNCTAAGVVLITNSND